MVGFAAPDSAGTYAKVAGGRGAYHVSGCHRAYDSDFWEGSASVKHSFDTHSKSGWAPKYVSVGAAVDVIPEKFTVVERDSLSPDSLGDTKESIGFAGGVSIGLDWEWVGLNLGGIGVQARSSIAGVKLRGFGPSGGIRIGRWNQFYATADLLDPELFYLGGGWLRLGLAGKLYGTRLWAGIGSAPYRWTVYSLKAARPLGPINVSLGVQGNSHNVSPANLGIDHEYGVSLGLEYRIPSL